VNQPTPLACWIRFSSPLVLTRSRSRKLATRGARARGMSDAVGVEIIVAA
jgi:hypothetical protein